MKVVGVGCAPGLLTEEAIRVLRKSRKVYGSRRAIEIARGALPRSCEVHEIRDYTTLSIPEDAVLLSTGDPMLAGLGKRGDEVIPGISSLQLACARLRLPLARVSIVDGHGRDARQPIAETVEEVRRERIVFLLPDPSFPLETLARALMEAGVSCTIALCEDLGYPEERITRGTPDAPPAVRSRLFSLVIGNFSL